MAKQEAAPAEKYEITDEQIHAFSGLFALARGAMTQAEAAKRAGVAQTTISFLENGLGKRTSLIDTLRVARSYGITPNEIGRALGLYNGKDTEVPGYLEAIVDKLKALPPDRLEDVRAVLEHYTKASV